MLLRDRGADRADGNANDATGLPGKRTLSVRPRSVVNCVLENAGYGAIVLGGDEQQSLGGRDFRLQTLYRSRLVGVVVLIVKGEISDLQSLAGEFVREKFRD